jgi:hypothetical protein
MTRFCAIEMREIDERHAALINRQQEDVEEKLSEITRLREDNQKVIYRLQESEKEKENLVSFNREMIGRLCRSRNCMNTSL